MRWMKLDRGPRCGDPLTARNMAAPPALPLGSPSPSTGAVPARPPVYPSPIPRAGGRCRPAVSFKGVTAVRRPLDAGRRFPLLQSPQGWGRSACGGRGVPPSQKAGGLALATVRKWVMVAQNVASLALLLRQFRCEGGASHPCSDLPQSDTVVVSSDRAR